MNNNNIVIEEHLGLVHLCCQRFRKRGIDYEDIFQSGCIGLTKAAKNFDCTKGVVFSTYAVPVILGEIKSLFRENRALKISRKIKELEIKINYERENFLKVHEREPSVSELSELLNIDCEQIIEALESSRALISLDSPLNDSDDNKAYPEIPVEFDDEKISTRVSLIEILKTFEKRDKNLIFLRFFKGATQSNTAKELGMTQVQVSRREKVLLKMIREKLA
ncbi:MAG: sigma-70 family RNA polymerase sigma factor [Acutalibacteraceae bacterium]